MRFRVAIVSTPRSGNTWLRHLLMRLYDIPGLAVHSPAELDWALLPDRCVFQLHWPPTVAFRASVLLTLPHFAGQRLPAFGLRGNRRPAWRVPNQPQSVTLAEDLINADLGRQGKNRRLGHF